MLIFSLLKHSPKQHVQEGIYLPQKHTYNWHSLPYIMVPPSSPYWSQRLGSYPKFVFSVHSALNQSWISISSSFHIHPLPPLFSFVAQSCSTLCDPMHHSTPGFPVLHHLPELAQTHIHWVNDAIQPSHSLSSPSPAFNLSQPHCLFQWVGSSHQVAKVLEPQHQSLQACSGLISFRIDMFDLLAVQGTLKRLLQQHSSKASIPWHLAFLMIQLSHPYMTTGKTINWV